MLSVYYTVHYTVHTILYISMCLMVYHCVLIRRQLSSVEQQLFASRQVRKLHPVMATKPFSPLSPVLKKMSHSQEQLLSEAEAKNK